MAKKKKNNMTGAAARRDERTADYGSRQNGAGVNQNRPPMNYGQWQNVRNSRPRPTPPQQTAPARRSPRLEPYQSEIPRQDYRNEAPRKAPQRPVQKAPQYRDFSPQQMPRQMHIPIPPSESGRYPDHFNPYYDRPEAVRATDKKARDIQQKLKNTKPAQPPRGRNQTARPTAAPRPAYKAPAPKKKQEAPGESRWAIPEGSPLYAAYSRQNVNSGREDGVRRGQSNRERMAAEAQRKRAKAAEARRKAAEKAERRSKRRYYIKAFFIRLAAVFVICAMSVGLVYYNTFSPDKKKGGGVDYSVRIGEKHNFSADGANAYRNGVLYIDFTALARILGISSVGSTDSMRFIIPSEKEAKDSGGTGREEYVIFSDGMRGAFVNGTGIIMEGTCRSAGLDIWVPLSFVEHYMSGITVERDGSLVVITADNADSDSGENSADGTDGENAVTPGLSFTLCKPTALSHVEYPS